MYQSSTQPQNYAHLNVPTRLLLGPGPSLVDPRVLQVMGTPLLGHLDPKFLEIMDKTQEMLRYVFQTKNKLTIPISGTGSAAMEASMANMIEPGDKVLICVNGYFGIRLIDMARRYGAQVEMINKPWGEVFTAQEVQLALEKFPAKIVGIVHAETSTGARQPIKEIAGVVHQFDGLLVVDAVTSLGGLPVEVDENDIDVCYSGSQKCLSCPPGVAPITFGLRAEAAMDKRKSKVPNWYFDVTMLRSYWGLERTYHHTAPITMNYALHEALRIVAEEGLEARWARHQRNAQLLWDGIEAMGLKLHVPLEYRLPSLTTVRVPEGVNEAQVRSRLLNEYNIEIGGGLGELKGKIWRIGLMGYSSKPENVLLLLAALKAIL